METLLRWRQRLSPQAAAPGETQGHGQRAGGNGAVTEIVAIRIAPDELTEQYAAALREYCAKGEEAALCWAYQLGYRAASEGLSLPALVAMHQKALEDGLREMVARDESTHVADRVSEFLAQVLAPFEQRHRRCQDEHSTLNDLNQGLEHWLNAMRHKLTAAQDQLLEQRKAAQRKDELICVLSHEMHGSLSVLKSGLGGKLNAHGERLLEVALRSSARVIGLVSDSADAPTIGSGAVTFDEIRTAAGSGPGAS